jgi:hypothetical protein
MAKYRAILPRRVGVFFMIVFCLLGVNACSNEDNGFEQVLKSLEKSVAQNSAARFMENFASSYWDAENETNYEDLAKMTDYTLAHWKNIQYKVFEKSFYREAQGASIVHSYTISGTYNGAEKIFNHKLKLNLTQKGKAWQVQSGFVLQPLFNFSSPEKALIGEIMKKRMDALNKKNLDQYLGVISRDYFDSQKQSNFEDIAAKIRHYFEAYESITFTIERLEISLSGKKKASVDESFHMTVVANGQTILDQSGRELIGLVKEAGTTWKIYSGL